jgi:hypothetical protein
LEPDEVEEVDGEPHDPSDQTTQLQSLDVGDRGRPTDRREVALVAVMERPSLTRTQPGQDDFGGVAALLHSDRGNTGQDDGSAVRPTHADHVAECKDLGITRQRQIRFDCDAAGAVTLRAGQLGQSGAEAGGRDPSSPDDGPAGDSVGLAAPGVDRHALAVDPDNRSACKDGHAEPLKRSRSLG